MITTDQIGIAIISFNRPARLQQLLVSLERQAHLGNVGFHLFQDGAVSAFDGKERANPDDILRSIAVFKDAQLPKRVMHIRPTNVGVGIAQFGAYEYMTAHYEYVIVLENDVVLSPHYLRLARVLFGQIGDRDDIFSFSLGFRKVCPKEEARDHLHEMRFGTAHWWGEGFLSERWREIRPHFMEYYALIRGVDYRKRPSAEIHALYQRKGWTQTATSQDGGKDMAVHASGKGRIVAVVNRGVSTGMEGEHFRQEEWLRMGFHQQEPYVFEEDATLEEFVLPETR